MMDTATAIALTGIGVTVMGSIIAGSIRFGSMETRLNSFEGIGPKVDKISESVARIEGRLQEVDTWKK
jgi:ABC-type lipoprotein release transport system permease subunit